MRWVWLAAGLATCVVMAWQWPLAIDLHLFLNAARHWLAGQSALYDAGSPGFFYMPWSLALFAPLALLPEWLAVGVWTALALSALAVSVHVFQSGLRYAWLVALNLHLLALILLGQFDAMTLLGVTAGWWGAHQRKAQVLSIGLWLMMMKPVNALLPALLLLWAIRGWRWRAWLSVLSWPLVSVAASFLIAGADWPARYLLHTRIDPPRPGPISTVWRLVETLHVPWLMVALVCAALLIALAVQVQRHGVTMQTFGLGLATTLTVTPYALGAHYVLLVPALVQVRSRVWLAVLAAAAWLPLLRSEFGERAIWIEVLFPALTLAALWALSIPAGSHVLRAAEQTGGEGA
jgi:hypothetical protein